MVKEAEVATAEVEAEDGKGKQMEGWEAGKWTLVFVLPVLNFNLVHAKHKFGVETVQACLR